MLSCARDEHFARSLVEACAGEQVLAPLVLRKEKGKWASGERVLATARRCTCMMREQNRRAAWRAMTARKS
eukprot:1998449-Pyramimonas_sp.AAC.1